jgi:hypothetical protein
MHKKKHPIITLIKILIFTLVLLFYYADILTLSIKGIAPLLILPITVAYSMFHSPIRSAIVATACGIFMDACVVGSFCFNAVILLVIATFVSVSSNNIFNKNIQSAFMLSLICCGFYFVFLWICFHTDNVSLNDSLIYLFKYAFPAAVYSALFIGPFYYVFKRFNQITLE